MTPMTRAFPSDFLFGAATNVLSDFYNIPLSMGAFATGAKEPNWQAGLEGAMSSFMASVVMSVVLAQIHAAIQRGHLFAIAVEQFGFAAGKQSR